MRVGRICSREVMAVGPSDTVAQVTHLMRENHVGSVIVQVDGRPVGVVTDRDVAIRCGGLREVVADVPAKDVMSRNVLTVSEDDDLDMALERMRDFGVRRLPVVNEGGLLAGVLTLDDCVRHLALTLRRVADVVQAEFANEAKDERPSSPAPA